MATYYHYTIEGRPITKKNSQRIVNNGGRPTIIQSKQYKAYEKTAILQIRKDRPKNPIDYPVEVTCLYYMPTRRRVDILNLLAATHDILVKAEILKDDNSDIVCSVDGSRVLYDKIRPRVEIMIR